MAKLSTQEIADLAKIGIKTKTDTDVEAKKILMKFLHENEVDGVENDTLSDLIGMAEVFYEPPAATLENELEEEEQLDELAEEVSQKSIKKLPISTTAKSSIKSKKSAPVDGEKFDARNNEKHMAMLEIFLETFPENDFQIDTLKQGFTVRVLGDNGKTTILNFDDLKISGGELVGNLYTNRFKSAADVSPFLPESIQDNKEIGMYRAESHPSIRKITQTEFFEIINGDEGFLEETLNRASGKDVTMGVNRKKLEAALIETKDTKKPIPGKKAKIAEPELEEEIEDEIELEPEIEDEDMDVDVPPAPAKKAPVKKAPVKKAVAKKK